MSEDISYADLHRRQKEQEARIVREHPKPEFLKDGWEWNGMRRCYENRLRRVYPVEDGFVISYDEAWLDGHYDTFESALRALDKYEETAS